MQKSFKKSIGICGIVLLLLSGIACLTLFVLGFFDPWVSFELVSMPLAVTITRLNISCAAAVEVKTSIGTTGVSTYQLFSNDKNAESAIKVNLKSDQDSMAIDVTGPQTTNRKYIVQINIAAPTIQEIDIKKVIGTLKLKDAVLKSFSSRIDVGSTELDNIKTDKFESYLKTGSQVILKSFITANSTVNFVTTEVGNQSIQLADYGEFSATVKTGKHDYVLKPAVGGKTTIEGDVGAVDVTMEGYSGQFDILTKTGKVNLEQRNGQLIINESSHKTGKVGDGAHILNIKTSIGNCDVRLK